VPLEEFAEALGGKSGSVQWNEVPAVNIDKLRSGNQAFGAEGE
jgi:hypothetical protein